MPVKQSNNNRIPSSNARQSDVAKRAIQEILPTQQMRYQAAFRVQGFEGVLYNRLYQGQKCTCQASQKQLASRLDQNGKAKPGFINELLTGAVFDVSGYGQDILTPPLDPFDSVVSPDAPVDKHQGVFDNITQRPGSLPASVVDQRDYGDNGPIEVEFDIDQLASDFNMTEAGYSEASCAICFGSGYVGGYSPLYGRRIVRPADQVDLKSEDVLDVARAPWTATSKTFSFTETLPYGAVALDIIRVMNGPRACPANFTVDGQAVNEVSILRFCDGRPHVIQVMFAEPTKFTHVELQFKTSSDDAFFEFPRLNKSNDLSLLERTDPFQIILSPLIPHVDSEDIFVESTTGKTLIVQTINTWNTKQRQLLGWECQVRVVQPQELYNIMPRRGRIKTKPETTNLVHDNSTGYRRV